MSHHILGQKRSAKAVRVGQLELTLEDFNKEMATKVTSLLGEYHIRYVEPRLKVLETQIEWLEKPWWGKWWFRIKEVAKFVKHIPRFLAIGWVSVSSRFYRIRPEDEETPEPAEETPEPAEADGPTD